MTRFLAALLLTLALQKSERESCLRCRSALRDVDNSKPLVAQIFCQFSKIVFSDVVSGKQYDRLRVVLQPCERVSESLYDSLSTKIAAAYTCHYDGIALLAERCGSVFYLLNELA